MKKTIGCLILLIIIAIESYTLSKMYEEVSIKKYEVERLKTIKQEETINTEEKEEEEELQYLNLIQEEYKGYKVSAKLEIEKLGISTYVLEEYSKEAMQTSVVKFFGTNPNEIRKLLYSWA